VTTAGEDPKAAMTAITRGLVRLYKEHYGLGPTRARSWFCGGEVIVCVMEEMLTTKEQTMREAGDAAGIHETRQTVQAVMEPEMSAVVEKALERGVEAVVGGLNVEVDIATYVFLLQPGQS
jgi:uncharacterized protein YbcI